LSFSDFQIREANALPIAHTYTVMCVLPINLFNQVGDCLEKFVGLLKEILLANIYISMVLACFCYYFNDL
jgi:hypothetical protein